MNASLRAGYLESGSQFLLSRGRLPQAIDETGVTGTEDD
jgi:hypothetical protein